MKKALMLGNEAIARGAWEAGARVVSSYPGTPSTEITEAVSNYPEIYSEWAVNEKVALEVCAGASAAGVRAMCCMKHVGLNVAADPLFTLSYIGVFRRPRDRGGRRPGHALLPERAGQPLVRARGAPADAGARRQPGMPRLHQGGFRAQRTVRHPRFSSAPPPPSRTRARWRTSGSGKRFRSSPMRRTPPST